MAIDSQLANTAGGGATVRQPLPMPAGVPDSALGGGGKVVLLGTDSVVLLQAIKFEASSATIDPANAPILQQIVELLRSRPEIRMGVFGHSDTEGSVVQQLRLSKQRAEAVARYLQQNGIDPKRLRIEGFGDQRPIADHVTEAGRAQNRRVEFKILE